MRKIIPLILVISMLDCLWAGSSLTHGNAILARTVITDSQDLKEMSNFTILVWIFPTTLATERIYAKSGNLELIMVSATGQIRFRRNRGSVTQESLASNMFLTTGKWYKLALTLDKNNSPAGHLYIGDQSTPLREPNYTTQADGSGNWVTDAGNIFIGNRSAIDSGFNGQIGPIMVSSMVMTMDQMNSWFLVPTISTGTQIMINLGFDADSSIQQDLSGKGNNGVATNAVSSSNGPPINFPGGPN